ncbi:MAG: flagellar M-ring protein FliF C-terminal domain-containing protein [Acidobacteriota bacterium]
MLVKLRPGAKLSSQNVAAIAQLAASAVPGLQPGQVSVLDTSGNLLNRPHALGLNESGAENEAALEYRKTLERDIQAKVAQTLEPLLGPEHFRIGVSAEVDLSSGDLSEEVFDPNKSVMLTSQTAQDTPAGAAPAGVPGTASNLPRATASQASAAASVTNYGRKTENTTYQTSRVVRHTKLPQGLVKKISLSVLVDHNLRYEGGKPIVEAPAAEKLQVVKDLVAATVGIDTTRGDQLVVESFPFEATLSAQPLSLDAPKGGPGPGTALPPWLQLIVGGGPIVLGSVAGGVLVLLSAVAFFLWKRKKKKKSVTMTGGKQLSSVAADAEKDLEARLTEQVAEQQRQEAEAMLALKLPAVSTKKTDVLVKHIAAEVLRDPTAMAHVVRSWLNGEYQR